MVWPLQIEIEKLIYGGDGLARMPADEQGRGKTVFVPFVLPGEQVEVSIIESRSGFARAQLEKVVTPSPDRVGPDCPYFGGCGGCHYQHMSYEVQLRQKAGILRETLRRTAKLELQQEIQLHPSPPWNYRNRTRMHVRHTPEFTLGFNRHNSHEVLPVEACPISSPLINQAIAAVWPLGRGGAVPEILHGLQFFANHDDTQLLVDAYVWPGENPAALQPLAAALRSALPAVVGVVVFPVSSIEDESRECALRTSIHPETAPAIGGNCLMYHAEGQQYRVSGGSFFQTNRHLVDTLAQVATADRGGQLALDLYAGVGLFTLPLARKFDQVLAVESSQDSLADLRLNVPANVECIHATIERFLIERGPKLAPDLIVVDPPRAGLGGKTAALGRMSVSHVTYVSCDPATLARDLRLLLESGFRVEQVHLVDMFPQTFHMETVLHLAR
ncbi:MAG: class I SAM-dependent RNA methyltransferase [Candidatus Korobacteraceae bacterium]|jgi:23S rRNA (uracil1939-C5)-methyltransferase